MPDKRSLTDMFGDRELIPVPESSSPAEAPSKPENGRGKGKTPRKTSSKGKTSGKRAGRPSMAKRDEADLQRKEITLTVDQADELTLLARKLNRERDKDVEGTEPITESALLRCAVEAMLQVKRKLGGDNEAELLASLLEALGLN